MEIKTIGDILELQRGYDLPLEKMAGGEIPVVGSNGIVGFHNVKRSINPTITVGRSGSIGKVHYYDRETWVHNTALYVSNFKGNNPLYLYYLLKNLDFENLKSSSVVPSLNRNFVYPMKVPFVSDIKEQERIAIKLESIDKRIALNTRMNVELEASLFSLTSQMKTANPTSPPAAKWSIIPPSNAKSPQAGIHQTFVL